VQTKAVASHNKLYEECKDHSHFNCHLIAEKDDCEELSTGGNRVGDAFCQVSCGRCDYADTEDDEIFTHQSCYPFGKQEIKVSFFNQNPQNEDWVGMYPATADPNNLEGPVAWYWLCGTKKEKCKIGVGSVTFPWLPPGTYKAMMVRQPHSKGHGGPYSSYAESEPFDVVRGNTCTSRRLTEEEQQNHSNLRG
jgi:hypothetical protein